MVTKVKIRKSKRKNKSNRKIAKLFKKKKTVINMRGGSLTPAAAQFMQEHGNRLQNITSSLSQLASQQQKQRQTELLEEFRRMQSGSTMSPTQVKLYAALAKKAVNSPLVLGLASSYGLGDELKQAQKIVKVATTPANLKTLTQLGSNPLKQAALATVPLKQAALASGPLKPTSLASGASPLKSLGSGIGSGTPGSSFKQRSVKTSMSSAPKMGKFKPPT